MIQKRRGGSGGAALQKLRRSALSGTTFSITVKGPNRWEVVRRMKRSLEITDKFKGKTTGTRQIELSADLKKLTMTEHLEGQSRLKSILVFERE